MKKTARRIGAIVLAAAITVSAGFAAVGRYIGTNVQVNAAGSSISFETESNGFRYRIENGEATLTKYTGSKTVVKIPAQIDNYPVTSIGQEAFKNSKITSVTVPESVKYIGTGAFWKCSQLKSVKIPTTVRYIGSAAFKQCNKLTYVSLFSRKSRLPANKCDLVYIGKEAFQECLLGDVYIPDSVVYIDSKAFDNGSYSAGSVVNGELHIGDSVYSIGDNAFHYKTNAADKHITKIRFGDSLRYIGNNAFEGKKVSPGGAIYIPSTVVSIGKEAFIGSEGCGEGAKLLQEIADVSGGFDDVIEKAMQFASGDYVYYHLVSGKNNNACEKYCTNDAMWQWKSQYGRPDYLISEKMENIATVSKTGAYVGDTIKLTAEAGDAQTTGQYYYKFIIKNIDTNKTVFSKGYYSDKKTYTKKITANTPGIYNVTVLAYTVDENGNKTRVNTAYRKMVVSEPLEAYISPEVSQIINGQTKWECPLENSDNSNTITLNMTNNKLRLLCNSTGGVGYNSVSYSYTLKLKTGKNQYLSYTDDSRYFDEDTGKPIYVDKNSIFNKHIQFKTPGSYVLTVYAKDAANRVVKKTFNIKVR